MTKVGVSCVRVRVYIYTREILVSTVPGTVGTVTYSVACACAGEARNFCVEVCFTGLNLPDRDLATCGVFRGNRAARGTCQRVVPVNVRPIWRVVSDRDLATCGVFRGNRARPPAWSVCASFRPLDIHEYVFGAKSCATRLKPMGSARLSAAKGAAYVTLVEFVASAFALKGIAGLAPAHRMVASAPFIVRSRRNASLPEYRLRRLACARTRNAQTPPSDSLSSTRAMPFPLLTSVCGAVRLSAGRAKGEERSNLRRNHLAMGVALERADIRTTDQPTSRTRADGQNPRFAYKRSGDRFPAWGGGLGTARPTVAGRTEGCNWAKRSCGVARAQGRTIPSAGVVAAQVSPNSACRASDLRSETN